MRAADVRSTRTVTRHGHDLAAVRLDVRRVRLSHRASEPTQDRGAASHDRPAATSPGDGSSVTSRSRRGSGRTGQPRRRTARRPAPSSAAATRCAPRSGTAAWARSGAPPTPCCAATSRSRRSLLPPGLAASRPGRDVRAHAARGPRRRRAVAPGRGAGLRRGHRRRPAVDRHGAARGPQPRRHGRSRTGRSRPRAVAKIGIALLGALEVAHAAGVLHRDVKPANVLICTDGRCVLTDFGVARMPTDVRAHHARHGARLAALHLARAGRRRQRSARRATCSRSA